MKNKEKISDEEKLEDSGDGAEEGDIKATTKSLPTWSRWTESNLQLFHITQELEEIQYSDWARVLNWSQALSSHTIASGQYRGQKYKSLKK